LRGEGGLGEEIPGELGDKTRQRLRTFCTVIGTLADEYANNPAGECRPPVTPKIEAPSFR